MISLQPKRCRLLLICSLSVCVLATAAHAAPSTDRLPSLIRGTTTQLEIAYRRHPAEMEIRKEQLAATIAAWRAAPRTVNNDEQMAAWLRSAIRSSMPGSREEMPAAPSFKSIAGTEKRALEVTPVKAIQKALAPQPDALTDPFRDDPIEVTAK